MCTSLVTLNFYFQEDSSNFADLNYNDSPWQPSNFYVKQQLMKHIKT